MEDCRGVLVPIMDDTRTGSKSEKTHNIEIPEFEEDHGTDLLNATATHVPQKYKPQAHKKDPIRGKKQNITDLLHSAEILFNEGLIEDAKKLLRRIVRMDPSHVYAQKKLEEIHQKEMERMLRSVNADKGNKALEPDFSGVLSDQVTRKLDEELGLDYYRDHRTGKVLSAEEELLGSPERIEQLKESIEESIKDKTTTDRLDLGIAFFEMELYQIALYLFEKVKRSIALETHTSPEYRSATSLLAKTYMAVNRSFDAVLVLEPEVLSADLSEEDKLAFYYLLGKAYETLEKYETARIWYMRALRVDPHYRDAEDRVRFLQSNRTEK